MRATTALLSLLAAATALVPPHRTRGAVAPVRSAPGDHSAADAYASVQFGQVKKSLKTILKFWLMGAPVDGFSATSDVTAATASGIKVAVFVDEEANRAGIVADAPKDFAGWVALDNFANALYDELEDLATTDEAPPEDRLCGPPEAVAAARAALPPPVTG